LKILTHLRDSCGDLASGDPSGIFDRD
jgi:hypothetical protein